MKKIIGTILALLISAALSICVWHWYHETYLPRQEKTNDEVLAELLEEIDRGEWGDVEREEEVEEERPSEVEIAKGVEKAILDTLMKEFGFRFDVIEIQAFHIYDDKYRGFLHTNKVSLHHNMYSFWFDSNGAYYFIESWTEEYVDYDTQPFE